MLPLEMQDFQVDTIAVFGKLKRKRVYKKVCLYE